jgi:tRNA G18 (ribose-2'-O)-methylase SpoU
MVGHKQGTETDKIIERLREEGYLLERYQYIWDTILPSRLQRLAEVVTQRTRFISILLEAVDDGRNQSAVLRSAEAFGIQNVTVVKGKQRFQPNRKITQSAHAWLDIERAIRLLPVTCRSLPNVWKKLIFLSQRCCCSAMNRRGFPLKPWDWLIIRS